MTGQRPQQGQGQQRPSQTPVQGSSAAAVDALFRPVSDVETRLRALIFGAAGSGKTTTALKIALGLVGGDAETVCLLDSERGSGAKAGRDLGVPFAHAEVDAFRGLANRRDLVDHDPRIYIEAIRAASERYEVVVLDSLSHAWQACLELCDLAAKRFGGNSHKAWADVTPIWRDLIGTIVESRAHIICTARSKTKWGEAEGRNGKAQPKAIGMDPEIRQGTEYEFDLLLRIDGDHTAYVEKARSVVFDGRIVERPDQTLGEELAAWLAGGDDPMVSLVHQLSSLRLTVEQVDAWRVASGKPPMGELSPAQHRQVVAWLASNKANVDAVRAGVGKGAATPAQQGQQGRGQHRETRAQDQAQSQGQRGRQQGQQASQGNQGNQASQGTRRPAHEPEAAPASAPQDTPRAGELKAALVDLGITDLDGVGDFAAKNRWNLRTDAGAAAFWRCIHTNGGRDAFHAFLDDRARWEEEAQE